MTDLKRGSFLPIREVQRDEGKGIRWLRPDSICLNHLAKCDHFCQQS